MNSMNNHGSDEQNGTDTDDLWLLEEICSGFESEWSSDSVSLIANLVIQAEPSSQKRLTEELVSIDLEMRQSRSERINKEEYLLRLPGFTSSIQKAFTDYQQALPSNVETRHDSADSKFDEDDNARALASSLDSTPSRIGDYRIVQYIGCGGAGVVYEGIQESLGRRVAIKTLSQGHLSSRVSRFRREAKAIAKLHHTNIVKVFGSGIHDGTPYFAMQLIDGQNLAEVIDAAQKNRSSWAGISSQKEVAKIGVQVARALEHAHQRGVLHRDIKPSNLLLDENGTTWVTDFGLARLAEDKSKHAQTAGVVGTIRYVPPEGFSGQWDERSDIYSLGLTLYELLVLKPFFSGQDFNQLFKTICEGTSGFSQTSKIDGGDRDLETIIFKAIAGEPERRYQAAGGLADDLQRYLDGVPIKARPVSNFEKTLRWAKRSPAAAGLAALTMLVAFIGLPVVLWLWLQASSALRTVESQQHSIVASRDDAETARHASSSLLIQSYIDSGLTQQARRALEELDSRSLKSGRASEGLPWEIKYLNQRLDSSVKTFCDDDLAQSEVQVWHVAISPDDRQIATVHSAAPLDRIPGKVVIWDVKTGEQLHVLSAPESCVFACAFSNDGRQLATIGMNLDHPDNRGTLCKWNVKTGERTSQIKLQGVFDSKYLSISGYNKLPGVAFSRDDKLTVSWPDPVEIRDNQTQETIWKSPGSYAMLLPEERVLVLNRNKIEIRRLATGEKIDELQHAYNLSQFKLSADGKGLSCVGLNRMLTWDSIDRIKKYQAIALKGIRWGAISPDGTKIIHSTGKGELKLQNLDRSKQSPERSFLGHLNQINHGCFSHDGNWLLTGGADGTARLWSLRTKESVAETNLAHERISNICFSENGDQVHFVARRVDANRNPYNAGTIELDDLEFSKKKIKTTHIAHWPRSDFSFSHDRKFLLAPVSEPSRPENIIGYAQVGKVGIWECGSWEQQKTLETGFSIIHSAQWNHSGKIVAIAGQNEERHAVKIFNTQSEVQPQIGEIAFDESIVAVAFHESRLAVSTGNRVSVWELSQIPAASTQNREIQFKNVFESKAEGVACCLDFSPDGTRLATANRPSDILIVYDVESGKSLYTASGPRAFGCVRFSPCGKRVALSGDDAIVNLCDAESGYRLLRLSGPDPSPGTASINSRVVFSPDGRRIATNTWEGKIRYWEVANEENN